MRVSCATGSDEPEREHRVGDPGEARDVRAGDVVSGRTVLVGRIEDGATTDSAVDATVALTASSGNKLQEDAND